MLPGGLVPTGGPTPPSHPEAARLMLEMAQTRSQDRTQVAEWVLLELFVQILPPGGREWVLRHHPDTTTDAIQLMENYLAGQSPITAPPLHSAANKSPMSLKDGSTHGPQDREERQHPSSLSELWRAQGSRGARALQSRGPELFTRTPAWETTGPPEALPGPLFGPELGETRHDPTT
ncbi:unnamed protein product [Caretta caretta]